ncbi:hypothetical protein D9758_008855 [Tetrapyrgos nigripes]|uniref:Uncharacterized protein n=1 Tax=Tetrapyrgos nigripes TaxID=182062 RepID=A0A8H5CMM3_9AGAR|nr:hypothetical protein D9758_008855 [Tetrapyrgos nigripes]
MLSFVFDVLLSLLLIKTSDVLFITYLCWFLRLLLLALCLRSYIIPLALSKLSKHVRVRSISLRSIRGLYVYREVGTRSQTWKVERIGYSWSSESRHLTIIVEGLTLELNKLENISVPLTRHKRSLTVATLSYTNKQFWEILSGIFILLDPILRPLIRTFVLASLRTIILTVPSITSAIFFDIQLARLVVNELAGLELVSERIRLHTSLEFTPLEHGKDAETQRPSITQTARKSYSISAWKSRFKGSFRRSWNRAVERSLGTGSVSLELQNIVGSISPETETDMVFFRSPATITLQTSLTFNPAHGSLSSHSVKTDVKFGGCFLEMDALLILSKLFESKKSPVPDVPSRLQIPSSPLSPIISPTSPFSRLYPPTLRSPSPVSPTSPTSPLRDSLSASLLPRRHHYSPCMKLKDTKQKATLSLLNHIRLHISSVSLNTRSKSNSGDAYKIVVEDITTNTELSDPQKNAHHSVLLGRNQHSEAFDSDAYCMDFSISEFRVTRTSAQDQIRLLALKSLALHVLTTQWPSPLLVTSPFIGGDPNAPFLMMRLNVGSIHVAERAAMLTELMDNLRPAGTENEVAAAMKQATSPIPIPRLVLQLECGPIIGRLLVGTEPVRCSHIFELRTEGIHFSFHSHFNRRRVLHNLNDDFDHLPLEMSVKLCFALQSTFVRTIAVGDRRKSFKFYEPSGRDFSEEPPFVSIDTIEIRGDASMFADIRDDTQNTACIHPSTLLSDVCLSVETICFELWHPDTKAALLRMLQFIPQTPRNHPMPAVHIPLHDRLPTGLTVTASLGRLVVFVTTPDINPRDDMELSRGFALRATGISAQYCALDAGHICRSQFFRENSVSRHQLRLPGEQRLPALESATASAQLTSKAQSAFINFSFSHIAVRSALSTQYAADDPYIAERDDVGIQTLDFLKFRSGVVQISLRSSESSTTDSCEVNLRIALVEISFLLAHIYSAMLGFQTIKSLASVLNRPEPTRTSPSHIHLHFDMDVNSIQAYCTFRKEHAFLHIKSVTTKWSSGEAVPLRWQKAVCWVRMPVVNNRWEEGKGFKWEELLSLQEWCVVLPSRVKEPRIVVDGRTARFRIPSSYVLADLVLDISVIFKALRHLYRITNEGKYSRISTPEAEGPKDVPSICISVFFLTLEAADDPFEAKLNRIFNVGPEGADSREEREEAFKVKVYNILRAEGQPVPDYDQEWEFGPEHSVSIQEARTRLDQVHFLDWKLRLDQLKQDQAEAQADVFSHFQSPVGKVDSLPLPIETRDVSDDPPLLRIAFTGLSLNLSKPSFSLDMLPDFLLQQGLPLGTEYSLLIPLHLGFTLSSLQVTLRDYPVAMVDIPPHEDDAVPALEFDTDLVVAEEMGSELSVDWVDCPVLQADQDVHDIATLNLSVPKTIMPVKTYANPEIRVTSPGITSFSWAVSYAPATQDLMRVVETLTSSPRDASPGMGFWDKMRLVFHWSIRATFKGEVRYYMKGKFCSSYPNLFAKTHSGLRDPHDTLTAGSGFALVWEGNTKLLVGRKNEEGELVQIISDTMSIAIPKLEKFPMQPARSFRKICAKLSSGVRFGVGFVFERTCGPSCPTCYGTSFNRQCRYFDFKPHHEVKMDLKHDIPLRNDYIKNRAVYTSRRKPSPIFWSWWSLFDSALSLPIRYGSYYPRRIISPKFGRHIATIKYRVFVPKLYVMHGYQDDSKETWADGVTPWVGVKAMIDELQVDMHQRDQESSTSLPTFTKATRHKPFYAAELVMKGLDLRAIVATFPDPLKKSVELQNQQPGRSNYRSRNDFSSIEQVSAWHDSNDFVEIDWSSSAQPELHILPVASCPRFAYFKRNLAAVDQDEDTSKFGNEDTHQCVLGTEPTVPQVQLGLVSDRIKHLRDSCQRTKDENTKVVQEKMISLLKKYTFQLARADEGEPDSSAHDGSSNYQIPADDVSPDDAIRDIMMQYYHCSRARRGLEYHMATRAVKFIRDQAEAALSSLDGDHKSAAQAAASVIKRILIGDSHKSSEGGGGATLPVLPSLDELDPMNGWSDGVSLRKSHCCLLLKPQVVLRNKSSEQDICVVAAIQAKLQSFAIMDDSNADDPVSGKVMSRTYAALSGMQTFAPTFLSDIGDGCVPLEVLIDLRCESDSFERLVPQTDATFHYDKFNRLRLRNNVTSVVPRKSVESATSINHLQDQTDLVQVDIPRFTVSATDQNFQTISHIITKVLLFSDAAHKTRLDKLETMLFTYDFTDLNSSADVVAKMQRRMRLALRAERMAEKYGVVQLDEDGARQELMKLRAHKYLISEELNMLFEAIKLAQDRSDDQGDRKSALLLHASSSEISWRMLDESRDLLTKLSVQNIHHYWLSRQDSSTVNNLSVGNLQAFDGSKDATWAEILCKHDEPANHPLLKKRLFLLANWSILPPVGGITIYEAFELTLHPLRLQVDARVGRRILEYVWPSRKNRRAELQRKKTDQLNEEPSRPVLQPRVSLDTAIPTSPKMTREFSDSSSSGLSPPSLRRLGASRSFTDLRSSAAETSQALSRPKLHRTRSSELLRSNSEGPESRRPKSRHDSTQKVKKFGDAAEMRTRSSQKTFVLVRISSLHLLLSIMKEESFVCQDARIRTRDLEYRNQTTSFEELVNQFIPSDTSWKGWVKMAFHQPLVPVLPVARELISKTKWIALKGTEELEYKSPPKSAHPKPTRNIEKEEEGRRSLSSGEMSLAKPRAPAYPWKKASHRTDSPVTLITPSLTTEPESFDEEIVRPPSRNRVLSAFRRKSRKSERGV